MPTAVAKPENKFGLLGTLSEALLGEVPMPAMTTVPMIPKDFGGLTRILNQILRKADQLGFDTMAEARNAIRNAPDWAQRWDVPDVNEQAIGDAWRKASLLNNPAQPSAWEVVKQYVGEGTLKARQAASEAAAKAAGLTRRTFRAIPGGRFDEPLGQAAPDDDALARALREGLNVLPGGKK